MRRASEHDFISKIRLTIPLQQGDIMALALLEMWPNAFFLNQPQERVRRYKTGDRLFVFATVECAG
ncbi:hypothetical protein D3C76_1690330 [compost metagenome]